MNMAICGNAYHIFFQQNSPRLTNSCKNYAGMTNIFCSETDDKPKVLNIEVSFRAQRLFFAFIAKALTGL